MCLALRMWICPQLSTRYETSTSDVELTLFDYQHVDYGRKMKDILELIDLTNKGGTTSSGGGHIII